MIELEQYFTLVLCLVGNSAPATKTTLQKIYKNVCSILKSLIKSCKKRIKTSLLSLKKEKNYSTKSRNEISLKIK